MSRRLLGPAASAAVFALDRTTKLWIEHTLDLWSARPVIPGFFDLVHSQNRGIAFGLFNDGATDLTRWLLIGVSVLVLGFLIYSTARSWRDPRSALPLPLFLMLGGALGNLYDRALRGYVTDFADFYIGAWHWPAFNIADAAITLGAVWLLLQGLRAK
jgi:signal peptidase II